MEVINCLTAIFLVIVLPLGTWLYCNSEGVFIFNPLIETKLPPGFTQEKFDSIKVGMTKAEVL
ncbi:MAG: hypothetical protein ACHBN1_12115 [Heteroscytonema crispum UTEX LB 1556]